MTRFGRRRRRFAAALVAVGSLLAGCATGPGSPMATDPVPPADDPAASRATPGSAGTPSSTPTPSSDPTTRSTPATPAPATTTAPGATDWRTGPHVAGFDVSRYNPRVDWAGLAASGHRFVYVKATEGTGHTSPTHAAQTAAARGAGLLVGSYHYARPAASDGGTQARFFSANGGAWTPDGRTLPGALDLEQSTAGPRCHGLDQTAMRRWVRAFADAYAERNGRPPVLYSKAEVWRECLGDATSFADLPLWLYDHDGPPGPLPAGWARPTLWQRGIEDGLDRNVYVGTVEELVGWASGLR